MARVILETGGEDVTVGGTDVDVIGTTTGGEVITVTGGNVSLDASFTSGGDTISLSGEAEAYTATVVGSRLVLTNGTTTVSIPLSTNTNAVVFGGDDIRTLSINAQGDIELGGQIISQTGTTTLEPGTDDGNVLDALAALQAAEQAVADFEEAQEMTSAEIRAEADATAEALADARAVRSDAQLQADLVGANADLAAAQEDVDAVAGLQDAIDDLAAAEAAADAAVDASIEANADEAGAEAEFEVLNNVTVTSNTVDLTAGGDFTGSVVVDDGGVLVTVIEADADGNLVITAAGEDYANIEALLDAVSDSEVAENNVNTTAAAVVAAQADVDLLDQVASANDERDNLEEFEDLVADFRAALAAYEASATAATEGALEATYEDLAASDIRFDTFTDTNANGTTADEIAAAADTTIEADIDAEQAERESELLAAEAANPRTDALEVAADAQADAEAAVEARNELIADANAAAAVLARLEDLEADIAAAEAQIEELGFETPVSVEGAAEVATDGSDVFIYVGEDGTISGFGDSGEDLLFVGEGYAQVDVAADADIDNDSVGAFDQLEIFVQQDGNDTILYIEDETFAGNVADGSFSGDVIVLTGVDADDVTVNADGTITIDAGTTAAAGQTYTPVETFA